MRRLVLLTIAFVLCAPRLAQAADRKMSDADSTTLAKAALVADGLQKNSPGWGFDGEAPRPKFPHLQFYGALPKVGGGEAFFAMDLFTADVWDLTSCREIKSPKLEGLQRTIRARIGLTNQRYKQIKSPAPCEP